MNISVLIPTYNSSRTIGMTIDSVLAQGRPADEIIVWDDGSQDNTLEVLARYGDRLRVVTSCNRGVATSRNGLADAAHGDLLAFLDHDDVWCTNYLETQERCFVTFPDALASYTGHVNFTGLDCPKPTVFRTSVAERPRLLAPREFLRAYYTHTGRFGSMSFCCVRRTTLSALAPAFHPELSGVDDSYLATRLPLLGSVAFVPDALVAYRILDSAQSANRLKMLKLWVRMFEVLSPAYKKQPSTDLRRLYFGFAASKRRQLGKLLMGADQLKAARQQFTRAAVLDASAASLLKSGVYWAVSFLPKSLQPRWPVDRRSSEQSP